MICKEKKKKKYQESDFHGNWKSKITKQMKRTWKEMKRPT